MSYSLVFEKLKNMLKPYESKLSVKTDDSTIYYLEYKQKDDQSKSEKFASVMIKKRYVSIYYMPIYHKPELINDISVELKKRMQGKSCFNFSDENDRSFIELDRLIKRTAGLGGF